MLIQSFLMDTSQKFDQKLVKTAKNEENGQKWDFRPFLMTNYKKIRIFPAITGMSACR